MEEESWDEVGGGVSKRGKLRLGSLQLTTSNSSIPAARWKRRKEKAKEQKMK